MIRFNIHGDACICVRYQYLTIQFQNLVYTIYKDQESLKLEYYWFFFGESGTRKM